MILVCFRDLLALLVLLALLDLVVPLYVKTLELLVDHYN